MNSDDRNVDLFNELKSFFTEQGCYNYPEFELYNAILKNSDAVTPKELEELNFYQQILSLTGRELMQLK